MKKILVVGGVAGGASFAARMRRLEEEARIIIFEKGDYVSYANCGLPYYIGDTIKERDDLLLQTPRGFKRRFNIDVRTGSEVIAVNTAEKRVTVRSKEKTYDEGFDFLLLAPGCKPIRPPLPGIDSPRVHTLRSIPDTDTIRAIVDKGKAKRAVVIGGGFIGLEMAENLRHRGCEVTLVELLDQVFAPVDREMAAILHRHLTINGVSLMLKNGVTRIVDDQQEEAAVILDNGNKIPADLIILAIGVKPDTAFLADSRIALSERGTIIVDDHLHTSSPEIYAAGDAVDFDNVRDGVVENNFLFNFTGDNSDGIDLGEGSWNIIIRDNHIVHCSDKGISVGQGSTVRISDNTISDCLIGIGIKDSGSSSVVINNNFCYNDTDIAVFKKNPGAGGGKAEISNCVFFKTNSVPLHVDRYSSAGVSFSICTSGNLPGTGNSNADPLYNNPERGDYSIAAASPCRIATSSSRPPIVSSVPAKRMRRRKPKR